MAKQAWEILQSVEVKNDSKHPTFKRTFDKDAFIRIVNDLSTYEFNDLSNEILNLQYYYDTGVEQPQLEALNK